MIFCIFILSRIIFCLNQANRLKEWSQHTVCTVSHTDSVLTDAWQIAAPQSEAHPVYDNNKNLEQTNNGTDKQRELISARETSHELKQQRPESPAVTHLACE